MKEEWLLRGAVVPVDVETTSALVAEIHRLIGVVGNMALAQASQEPVAWVGDSPTRGNVKRLFWTKGEAYHYATTHYPLYTTPPQRPWVNLTDEDWGWVADKKETSLDTFAHGAAWAADQLKEKNK